MSKTTKRKHVLKEILRDYYELPKENQSIVRVLSSKGNNLHAVESAAGEFFLASMPTKFRKNIWIKRGDFTLVEPIAEGDKVKAEIIKIINKDSIKYYKENNVWPKEFGKKKVESNDGDDDKMFVNTNRVNVNTDSFSDDSSDSGFYKSDDDYPLPHTNSYMVNTL